MKRKKIIIILCAVLVTFILGGAIVYAASYDSSSDPLVALSYLTDVFKPSIDKSIKSVSDRVTTAEGKISSIEKKLASGDVGTKVDSEEIAALTTQLEGLKSELDAAEKELAKLQSEKASSAEFAALKENVDKQNERIEGLLKSFGNLLEALLAERAPTGENYGFKTVTLKKGQTLLCNNYCTVLPKSGIGTYTFSAVGYDATASKDIASGDTAIIEHIAVFENGVLYEVTSDTSVIMVKGEYTIEG